MKIKKAKTISAIMIALTLSMTACANRNVRQPQPQRVTRSTVINSYTGRKTAKEVRITVKNLSWLENKDNAVPVILPPIVRPVWIVDHVTPDGVFVRGHWAFVKIKGFEWYIQAIENDENIQQLLRSGR